MPTPVRHPGSAKLRGSYAGVVTRFVGFLLDVLIIGILFSVGGAVLEYVVSAVSGYELDLSESPLVSSILMAAWVFAYSAYCLTAAGHTPGMAVFGVRVVRRDGRRLDGRHAVVRVLAFPLSFLAFGFGFVLIVLRRDRRALHDLIGRTAVVYAWDARATRPKFLAGPHEHVEVAVPQSTPSPGSNDR